MDAAIGQFAVVKVGFLGTLTGLLGYAGYLLALFLGFKDLFEYHVGYLRLLVKQVIDLFLYEISHKLIERYTAVGTHGGGTQLNLGLTLKHRFLNIHCNGSHYAVTHVARFKLLAVKLLDGTGNMLLECALVSSALRCILTVHKRVVLLTVLVCMGKGNLNIRSLKMNYGIQALGTHALTQQVFQSVA